MTGPAASATAQTRGGRRDFSRHEVAQRPSHAGLPACPTTVSATDCEPSTIRRHCLPGNATAFPGRRRSAHPRPTWPFGRQTPWRTAAGRAATATQTRMALAPKKIWSRLSVARPDLDFVTRPLIVTTLLLTGCGSGPSTNCRRTVDGLRDSRGPRRTAAQGRAAGPLGFRFRRKNRGRHMGMGTDAAVEGAAISLPKGGGAVSGLGEKFAADLFTGTGNFSVPIAAPPGRSGLQPALSLGYSTGNGNGPFGSGWQLSLPGVSRRTSRGIPRYVDAVGPGPDRADVFVLSGAEDLVPVAGSYPGRVQCRPRTEGLFARIEHVQDTSGNYWEVRGKDGSLTRYGTPRPDGVDATWRDPAVVADPADLAKVFGWRVTETRDALGNLIRYEYLRDQGQEAGHRWDQPLIARISYADYGDRTAPSFLVQVNFDYEPRPDPFSGYRTGFEVRMSLRCRAVRVSTHAADGVARAVREYRFGYQQAAFTGASLLTEVDVVGIDDQGPVPDEEHLPPLTFR